MLALLAAPATATAQGPMWATVNACGPAGVGVRASIPGDGTNGAMSMRFSLQWWSALQGSWQPVRGQASSPWIAAGSSRYEWAQEGFTFVMTHVPDSGVRLRGVAELVWTRGGREVRRTSLATRGGVAGVDGGSPPGLSLASCSLRR